MAECEGFGIQLSAYVDGELEGLAIDGVEAHLKACPVCAGRVQRERRLQAALRTHLGSLRAPEGLRDDVRAALRAARPRPPHTGHLGRWAAIAAAVVFAFAGGREWGSRAVRVSAPGPAEEVLSAHFRSLQAAHLTDVAASDHHTVKPWFAGKLDYSPPVPVLDSLGFQLLGGRLDYLAGRPTAVVVYARRQHLINLFVWPADSGAAVQAESVRGYQLVHGAAGGMAYWAVSDLNTGELEAFARLVAGDLSRGAARE